MFLILIIWVLDSCSKDTKINEPIVEIFSPENNQQYLLPDTIFVSFRVEHDEPIEYIRVSIDDKNMIPVSDQDFVYPSGKNYEGDIYLPLSALSEDNSFPPYYLHVVVSDLLQITHTYREISLLNKEMKYKGCFLISRSGINMLEINYFDNNYQLGLNTSISGDYSGSDISSKANILYLITSLPDLARAINCTNGELIWSKDPQLPYPEFNSILVGNNIVYFSTAIGRIIGLTINEGVQIFTTPVLPDSIPNNMCSTANYLLSDLKSRNSDDKIWVSFYKNTGNKFLSFPTSYETVSMYGRKSNNIATIFCNKNSIGSIIQFNVEDNNIASQMELNNIEIHHTCEVDENNFLYSSDNMLFHFNMQNQSYVKITDADEIIIDIKFDDLDNRMFILHPNKVDIFSYPGFNKITTIESTNLLVGVELKFGF